MDLSFNGIYFLCAMYVFFMWFMFLLDNVVFLLMRLFGKEPKPGSQYAFVNAFMQRGKDTEVCMAVVNIVAYAGFIMWLITLFQ